MQFGVFSVGDVTTDPTTGRTPTENERIHAMLAIALKAEEIGLDVFATGEHHNPPFVPSSPTTTLGFIAAKTKRLILSTATTLITTNNPVKIAGDYAALQHLAEECRSPDHRAPRLRVDAPALAYDEAGIHSIRILDLSQQGVKFAHRGGFHPGMKVKLLMENGLERRGIVRWSDEAHAGMHLVEPFGCAELESVRRLSGAARADPS